MLSLVHDMVRMIKKNFFYIIFILIIFLLDRISKFAIIHQTEKYGSIIYKINPFLNFELIWNQGIAFGMFSLSNQSYYNLLTLIIGIITIIILVFVIKTVGAEKYGFMMIFGGSLGNIFDRLYYSSVPDFIDIHYNNFHWFIFNVADIFITIGVLLLIYIEFFKKKNG